MALVLLGGLVTGAVAQDEQVLVIGHAEITDSYDPANGFTQTTGIVNRATYQTLVTFPDADASEILPLLATDWTISEDGTQYTFNLREGVTFSNGDPLTADDVVFSMKRLQNVNGNPSFLADPIVDVVADDDMTVTFTLESVRPSFLAELANTVFSITNADEVRANGGTDAADAEETDTAEDYLNQNSAGTGPYILESWTPQEETVLVRNPNYWGEDLPFFDRVLIVNIPEAATQKVALESGDIDLATDLSPDQVAELADNPDISVFIGPGNIHHFLIMNADPEIGGPVSDPLVQRAIRLALDYDGYTDLWEGSIQPGSDLAFGLAGAFGPDQALSRDLDTARELLAEAGFPDGFDIVMTYPDLTFGGIPFATNAQKIQADLAEVGINVELNPQDFQIALEEYREGDQGFGYWLWGPDINDPADLLSFMPGGKVAGERLNWNDDNAPPEIVALRDQFAVESDPERRLELVAEIQTALQETSPTAPFNQPAVQIAFRSDIEGFVWHPQWLLDVALLSRVG